MIILTMGLPGAGKGAVARKLRATYNFEVLATGELMRQEILSGSELGKTIKTQVECGDFVDNQIAIDMVNARIKSAKDLIIDGFPRNLEQAKAFEQILEDHGRSIDLVLYFDSDAEEDIKRLAARRICNSCHAVFNTITHPPKQEGICDHCNEKLIWREDDHPTNLLHKIDIYRQYTKPLKDYYDQRGLLTVINARQSSMDVYYDVLASSNKFTVRSF